MDESARRPRTVGVIGGGTAGYFAALAIKKRFPDVEVTVVESKDIPIIGVGEATTTLMPPFLHAQLGIDMVELFREVKPTFKLGIRFEWGPPGQHFNYPFGDADPLEAVGFDGDLHNQSLVSMMMNAGAAPLLRGPDGQVVSLLHQVKFGYHLDNAPFVRFLAQVAAREGVAHASMTVESAVLFEDRPGVRALRAADGQQLAFDLYVDASGFRSFLLEKSLGSPFVDYSASLFCDRAVVGAVPHHGTISPYTTAETMDAGWCWRIPVRHEDHRGYVHSSAFLDVEGATAELRAKNPGLGDTWTVKFRSGRHVDFWCHNVVGIGNAYGFVEPLESTALHMVIIEIAYLLAGIEAMGNPADAAAYPAFASESVGAHWDYLRWFLAIHYRFNQRLDTPFWRAARDGVDISGFESLVAKFLAGGVGVSASVSDFQVGDPAFGSQGFAMLMLGQRVGRGQPVAAGVTAEQWHARTAQQAKLLSWAMSQAEALEALAATPALLGAATGERSWCRAEAERVETMGRTAWSHPRSGMPAADGLLRSVRSGAGR